MFSGSCCNNVKNTGKNSSSAKVINSKYVCFKVGEYTTKKREGKRNSFNGQLQASNFATRWKHQTVLIIPWKAQKRNRKRDCTHLVFTELKTLAKDKLLKFVAVTVHKRTFRRYGEMGKAATPKHKLYSRTAKGSAYKILRQNK